MNTGNSPQRHKGRKVNKKEIYELRFTMYDSEKVELNHKS